MSPPKAYRPTSPVVITTRRIPLPVRYITLTKHLLTILSPNRNYNNSRLYPTARHDPPKAFTLQNIIYYPTHSNFSLPPSLSKYSSRPSPRTPSQRLQYCPQHVRSDGHSHPATIHLWYDYKPIDYKRWNMNQVKNAMEEDTRNNGKSC